MMSEVSDKTRKQQMKTATGGKQMIEEDVKEQEQGMNCTSLPDLHTIYHAGCPDGCMAAAILMDWMLTERGPNALQHATMTQMHRGDPLPKIADGSEVWMLDVSAGRAQMIELSERCKLRVIEHHADAAADCEGLDFCTFDEGECASTILNNLFWSYIGLSWLLRYIRDLDLGEGKLPFMDEFAAGLRQLAMNAH